MEKPILESDVCLETQMHLHLVEEYINMLEKKIINSLSPKQVISF